MEIITQLEEKISKLVEKLHSLEEENGQLKAQLASEEDQRIEVHLRVEALLEKLQKEME
ncbi:MAG: cell division protein ZapB [Desulfovibrio sp.]